MEKFGLCDRAALVPGDDPFTVPPQQRQAGCDGARFLNDCRHSPPASMSYEFPADSVADRGRSLKPPDRGVDDGIEFVAKLPT